MSEPLYKAAFLQGSVGMGEVMSEHKAERNRNLSHMETCLFMNVIKAIVFGAHSRCQKGQHEEQRGQEQASDVRLCDVIESFCHSMSMISRADCKQSLITLY